MLKKINGRWVFCLQFNGCNLNVILLLLWINHLLIPSGSNLSRTCNIKKNVKYPSNCGCKFLWLLNYLYASSRYLLCHIVIFCWLNLSYVIVQCRIVEAHFVRMPRRSLVILWKSFLGNKTCMCWFNIGLRLAAIAIYNEDVCTHTCMYTVCNTFATRASMSSRARLLYAIA